ncbi:hypothetical protein BX666DRAFT_2122701 [Dichotomocladium elegans]|nr:hypothetical protein BX666DRAFT_2122701 [Dichotomocladium elegans]
MAAHNAPCRHVDKRTKHHATETHGMSGLEAMNPVRTAHNAMVAPDFNCSAVLAGEISRFQLSACLANRQALVLFFIGSDITAPRVQKDLEWINTHRELFDTTHVGVVAMLTASVERVSQSSRGNNDLFFPLLSDMTCSVSRYFNVLNVETRSANRAAFILDQQRRIRYSLLLDDDRLSHSANTIMTMAGYPHIRCIYE